MQIAAAPQLSAKYLGAWCTRIHGRWYDVSVRAQANPCNSVDSLMFLCREKFLLGHVLRRQESSLEARYSAQ